MIGKQTGLLAGAILAAFGLASLANGAPALEPGFILKS